MLFGANLSAASTPEDPELSALLVELTQASLYKTKPLLVKLEATGGDAMLPLFSAMLAGDLQYHKKEKFLIVATKTPKGDFLAVDVFTREPLADADKYSFSKIRVNNQLRVYLREAIARIQLNSENPKLRLSAARTMLGDVDGKSAPLLRTRLEVENDTAVKDALIEALALYKLKTAQDKNGKLGALNELSGSLEPEVRGEIVRLLEKDADGKFAEPDAIVRAAAADALQSIDANLKLYEFIEQLFFGLSMGSVLLLAAIGLSITFGVMGVINMAHGEMMMLGAYTTYVVQLLMPNMIDYSLWVAIPAAFLVSGLVGVCIERGIIRFLHGRPLETLLATFGLSLVLQQTVRTIFSPLNRQVATPEWMSGSLELNSVLSITYNRLYILIFALLVFGILQLVLKKTSLGLNVRAVSQNRQMAKAIGIKTEWVDAMTFGLGSGIAGVAGVALSQLTNVGPNLGQSYIIDSFMVVVFGGVGNLLGTLVGGFTLGIANKFLEPLTGAVLANILILVFIILFIQKRPKGLFPQKGRAAND